MNKRKLASLEIKNDKIFVFPVLNFIDSLVQYHVSMDITRYQKFRLVVSGMIQERIERSYPGTQGSLFVEVYRTGDYFEIAVRDKGVPGWQDFSFDKNAITKNEQDLRNYLIDLYVDEVGLEKLGNEGQRVFLRIRIINPVEFIEPEPYEETVALDTNITIRPVKTAEDAIEAIRCIYSEYGYSYSYERLYYVNSFMQLIENKEIMSFLAVNDHGQTAGHFILAFSDFYKNMPEISTVVIKNEFRGLGLFSKFMTHCETVGKELGLRALMGQPVTFHPMSQKAFLRAGYTATSLLMSYINSDVESEYNKDGERLGLSVGVKILDENAYSRVYAPKEISGFVDRIYKRLGMKYDLCLDGEQEALTEMLFETNTTLKMSKIIVQKAGDGLEEELQQAIQDAIKQKSEMVELAINLNSPGCDYAYEIAKKHHFSLSGLIPGGENGDYLMMQMLPGESMNYDKLVVVGEFEELRNDIIAITKK
ncbi:MAG: GNAT family N-acetyltransferase [Ruminococcaceae bacterium]|nr:GNAT family N-acetyltransferase [Oscillospiraceae bacterium]